MINFKLSEAALDQLQNATTREARGRLLVGFIDERIADLQAWSRKNLGEEMTKFEIAAVKTFLYRELTGELNGEGDIMSLPRVPLEEHPAASV